MLQRDVHDEHTQRLALIATLSKPQTPSKPAKSTKASSRKREVAPRQPRAKAVAKSNSKRKTPALSTTKRSNFEAKRAPASAAGSKSNEAATYVWNALAKRGKRMSDASRDHIPTMHAECKKRGAMAFSRKLKPGQVIFFHNTIDANKDGRNNDWYTYVAIVDEVDGVGTAKLSSSKNGRRHRFVMNMNHHNMHETDSGMTLNAQLRARHKSDLPYTQYLAGELYAGSCTL